jgi:hypothetical protein
MRQVLVRALKNFDGHEVGQESWVELTERTAHLIVGNYLQLLWDPTWEQGYGASGYVPAGPEGDLD